MSVRNWRSSDRFTASSDFELKLVTKVVPGTEIVVSVDPDGVISSIKIGDVMPKLPSTLLLFQTLLVLVRDGNKPLSVAVAVPHAAVLGQFGGSGWPMVTVDAFPA